ncbi:hypothetical protein CHCC20441_1109 [Bacillus licheniformis]|uniref:Uncharacterized protein n=1 Tax=Bacillus licheniformis TaxID=1402 RepID=A0A8B5YJV1_BACLI|nr:hypothetical protein N399_17155 [Bacillus licheniformis CG-B52]KUL07395.1 hypothetical protein LI17339_19020 [Bacillus licheniformis LMG 17339]KYC76671.1 hypothetical protein B4090_3357 [Bacillus licheniformis]KYC78934.1 hypothetical protein B4092_3233 [Bacillus licheniformis]KYC80117.1 hypothetical protein B4091_3514 [Bacillus licheniformis]
MVITLKNPFFVFYFPDYITKTGLYTYKQSVPFGTIHEWLTLPGGHYIIFFV